MRQQLAEQATGQRAHAERGVVVLDRPDARLHFRAAGDWLRLLARKARLLVSSDRRSSIPRARRVTLSIHGRIRFLGPVWHAGMALPLGVLGAFVLWPDRRRLWLLYAMTAGYALERVAFFVVARYRHPLMPFVLLFSAVGAIALYNAVVERIARDLRLALIAAAAFAVILQLAAVEAGTPQAITENNLGTAFQEDGRPQEAIDRYQRALAFDADYAPALNNLGTALRAAGRIDEAVRTFGQALARNGAGASVHYNLGNALMARGDAAGAVKEFEAALAGNPKLVEATNNLGQALAASARTIARSRRSARPSPSTTARSSRTATWRMRSRREGRRARPLPHFERAIVLAPADAAVRYDYGSLLVEVGAFDAGSTALREAIRLKPDYAEAHNNLGIALASQGRLPEAITHWEEAIRLRPDFADARRNLERARK